VGVVAKAFLMSADSWSVLWGGWSPEVATTRLEELS
jgi:hypothetical protein